MCISEMHFEDQGTKGRGKSGRRTKKKKNTRKTRKEIQHKIKRVMKEQEDKKR